MLLYIWLKVNIDVFVVKMLVYYVLCMFEFVFIICDVDNLVKVIVFYGLLKDQFEGMFCSYDIMMDELNQCLWLKDIYQFDFDVFFVVQ